MKHRCALVVNLYTCVRAFSCVLTSSRSSLAAFASLKAGCIQQAHVGHLDSRSSLGYQLPGSFPQLSPPLCISLLQMRTRQFEDSLGTVTKPVIIIYKYLWWSQSFPHKTAVHKQQRRHISRTFPTVWWSRPTEFWSLCPRASTAFRFNVIDYISEVAPVLIFDRGPNNWEDVIFQHIIQTCKVCEARSTHWFESKPERIRWCTRQLVYFSIAHLILHT